MKFKYKKIKIQIQKLSKKKLVHHQANFSQLMTTQESKQ